MAPGNAGTAQIAHNLDIGSNDIEPLAKIARGKGIDLAVIGPEAPLADGIVDRFQSIGIPAFGPTKAATQIESSKVFAKEFMKKVGVPLTPRLAASRASATTSGSYRLLSRHSSSACAFNPISSAYFW